MTSAAPAIQNFNLGGKIVPLDIKEVPALSSATKKIFNEMGHPAPSSLEPHKKNRNDLELRIKEMSAQVDKAAQELQTAKDNSTRDKIIGLLKTLLPIVILAAGILGFTEIFSGGVATASLLVGIFGFVAANIYAFYSTYKDEHTSNKAAMLMIMLFGFAVPIYQALTKISNQQEYLDRGNKLLTSFCETLPKSEPEKELQEAVAESWKFYETNGESLAEQIKKRLEVTRTSLAQVQALPVRNGEEDYRKQIEELETAQTQLDETLKAFHLSQTPV